MSTHIPITDEDIFAIHRGGKVKVSSRHQLSSMHDLSLSYTPGVARVCEAIVADPRQARTLTGIGSTVAVVSDGSAVLGLGNIGPAAALPVMEGKAQLFEQFAGLNAIPIVLDTQDTDELVHTITHLAPSFGAINLEDIAAPRCFEVEQRLINTLDIPVMHDDQHGTAVVITAALHNAVAVLGTTMADLRVVVAGAGAAGVACVDMLRQAGVTDIIVVDSRGAIHAGRDNLTPMKQRLAETTNPRQVKGSLADALRNATTFIGVSRAQVGEEELKLMAPDPILFPLANPDPEIEPELAQRYGSVVATGRSDYPNQINNVLAFPGIFHGALAAEATQITPAMKAAASKAIADLVEEPHKDMIMPSPLDERVAPAVSAAVARAWEEHHA